ncbi:tetratricopeptide repeat protein [Streptomyces sp. NPDC002343]
MLSRGGSSGGWRSRRTTPHTLTTRNNLAPWRREAGDAADAAAAYEHLLADRLRVLGEDHPRTLATRHNLAYWRVKAGETPRA